MKILPELIDYDIFPKVISEKKDQNRHIEEKNIHIHRRIFNL